MKAPLLLVMAVVMTCGAIACGTPGKPTVKRSDSHVVVQGTSQAPSGEEHSVQAEELRLSDVVAPHILPLTKGPWPESIQVTDRAITFRKTGKVIPYRNVRYCSREGEGPASRLAYDVPVCLPSGRGLALFEAAYGYECWNAHVTFFDPEGRLLSTKDVIAWPSFGPDGERYINYNYGNDYDENRDWKGVQLCGIDGAVFFDIQSEKARTVIREKTGRDFADGGFYHGPDYDIWVVWDQVWEHFIFAFWAAEEGKIEARSFYLFVFSAEGNLVRLTSVNQTGDTDAAVNEAIDSEFARLGTTRGGSK